MKITETRIPDVKIIEPKVLGDERGFFMETWNEKAFREAGIAATFVQDRPSCRTTIAAR
jgi:dTDP-4-dehydrorhamnose 3,5-epimerase